jgi:hypothetical protein
MASNTFIKMKDHGNLGANIQEAPPFPESRTPNFFLKPWFTFKLPDQHVGIPVRSRRAVVVESVTELSIATYH